MVLAACMALAAQSHAIIGLGGHIAPNLGASVKGSNAEMVYGLNDQNGLFLDRSSVNSLSGFGVKFWIDALPKVDIEGTANFQFRTYSASLYAKAANSEVDGSRVDLSYDPEFPGVSVKAKPALALGTGDLTVLYPFFKPSFVIGYFQLHGGAGVTYTYQSKVIDQKFLSEVAASTFGTPNQNNLSALSNPATLESFGKEVAAKMAKESYDQGVGLHAVVGARAKLFMFSVYANEKYYIGGVKSPLTSGFVTEVGGGFAF